MKYSDCLRVSPQTYFIEIYVTRRNAYWYQITSNLDKEYPSIFKISTLDFAVALKAALTGGLLKITEQPWI